MLRRSLCVSAVILAGVVGFAGSAKAQTADVLFNGAVLSACALTPTAGTLIPDAEGTVLSSSEGTGALSGTVTVLCNNSATISVAQPVPLLATPTPDGIELASELRVGGSTITGLLGNTLNILALETVVADVDMTATLASGLPAGVYNYSVTVTATPN
jgi:hypothetical protein